MDRKILYDVFRAEMRDRKIPLSLGKTCPVKCTFCYEKDHSYRTTYDVPLTTQEHWDFILNEIRNYPTRKNENWIIGGNEYMEWTDLFLHPRVMHWLEEFLDTTDKAITMFTVGYVKPSEINRLAEKYPGRINFELSVITLGRQRKNLMPNGPTAKQVMEILDGPAVTSANFYSFGPSTMSEDARIISRINKDCFLWMGCLTPLKYIDPETTALMRLGKRFLPQETRSIYELDLPNEMMIQTESDITAFLNRHKILKVFDACEVEKRDTVVMAGNVYKILTMFRRNRARFLYVPNATLGGDSNCSSLLTFSDVARRLNGQTRVFLPKVIMERTSNDNRDIAGESYDDFQARFPRCQFKVLHKVNSKLSNKKLYEKGYLKNYYQDCLQNPLYNKFELVPLPH